MPTPVPSSPVPPPAGARTASLPLASCSRLAWRVVVRLGAMPTTSARATSAGRALAGTMADSPRTAR
jgi:hypothetical protein